LAKNKRSATNALALLGSERLFPGAIFRSYFVPWAKGVAMSITAPRKARKHLSADALLCCLRDRFKRVPDARHAKASIALPDALMAGFALFSLKDPSLLAFDQRRADGNLQKLYGITQVPSDTQMREILDVVAPEGLHPAFADLFGHLQRGQALPRMVFLDDYYLVSIDGTGYFSSHSIHCDSCLKSVDRSGQIKYSHQMVSAVLVHPDRREVIPLGCEPIVNADGSTKNDCERNASKRLLERLRRQHPRLPMLVVEDGLASNAPHVRELQRHDLRFLLGCKPGDHEFLYQRLLNAYDENQVTSLEWKDDKQQAHCITFASGLPLNESNPDLRVNFLQYLMFDAHGAQKQVFSWITDLEITRDNAWALVRGARARWKIENETFNTLKNQGYQFEHNFGHGYQHLSVVFALLMMLAFLVDQVQQLCCPLFQAVLKKLGSKRLLWDNLRSHFRHFAFGSFEQLYQVILHDLAKELPPPPLNTS
jgi:hypothetical protein